MALTGGNLVAGNDLEAPLALLDKLKSLQGAAAIVMVCDSDNVKVRVVFDVLKDLLDAGKAVAERGVHMQISFAPFDWGFGFRACGIRAFLCMTIIGMIYNDRELCDYFS